MMFKQEHAERSFTAVPESIAAARSFAEQTLAAWHLMGRVDDVQLCISELASNAVNHGTRDRGLDHVFQVRIDADESVVRVEVEDDDPVSVPRVRQARDGDTGGRGMLIVQALAAAWGWESHAPAGKAVWSEFAISPA
ncbi:ATP-binding protein [Streptomyces sp. NPDC048191]|uniref:ATP-binding protein n=1 Tax=Streptomyces sp. NPDC048191 TaxID=3155484 RepID=UPI0033FCB715